MYCVVSNECSNNNFDNDRKNMSFVTKSNL